MKNIFNGFLIICITVIVLSCRNTAEVKPDPGVSNPAKSKKALTSQFFLTLSKINGQVINQAFQNLSGNTASFALSFSAPVSRGTWASAFYLYNYNTTQNVPCTITYGYGDSVVYINPTSPLPYLTHFKLGLTTSLMSTNGSQLSAGYTFEFRTGIDMTDKYPQITDDALMTLVEQQSFRYFWDYGHPVSGFAYDKTNGATDDCSTGGTGFGIMTIPVAINRNFITRADGLARMQKIVSFLKTKAVTFHGAFPHRINGTTGDVIVWQPGDNGADLVETSFLTMGLLTARQYFNDSGTAETSLRNDINTIYNAVDWNWFNKNQDGLWWLWSPNGNANYNAGWTISFLIRGWNEALITYVLAASSSTHTITKSVYDSGWANNGGQKNGQSYYGYTLPYGPASGGPLFTSQYSFLGINPNGLKDQYADYQVQTRNHALINQAYCNANPKNFMGYSNSCWGLTACSANTGYASCSPTNDIGVIAPTAALSSFPFTPTQSMSALRFFYYKLGNIIWSNNNYGFVDAFNLNTDPVWVGPQELVYDQLPITIAIENYRTGLIWNLFTSCPEVKAGLTKLGFTAPYL